MNDVGYTAIIFTTFILLGAVLPFVNQSFGNDTTEYNYDDMSDEILSDAQAQSQEDSVSGWDVLFSMGKIFFFTFGDIPYLLDILLFIPRAMFAVLIYRQVRSGGG